MVLIGCEAIDGSCSCGCSFENFFPGLSNSDVVTSRQASASGKASCDAFCTDVVIIGNGPSALSLSFMLSGNEPFYDANQPHPQPWLHERLCEMPQTSLLEQDLAHLSEGIEGRSNNPVSLLYDSLVRPNADFGEDNPSCLKWAKPDPRRSEKIKVMPHVILGSGLPGGSWQTFDPDSLTLSYGNWMELPGYGLDEYVSSLKSELKENSSTTWTDDTTMSVRNRRVSVKLIQDYYLDYVAQMNLSDHFFNGCTVTSVKRRESASPDDQSELNEYVWEVVGYHLTGKFRFRAKKLVLASGTTIPRRLEPEEDDSEPICLRQCRSCVKNGSEAMNRQRLMDFAYNNLNSTAIYPYESSRCYKNVISPLRLYHSLQQLNQAIATNRLQNWHLPVLVVGSGISAADAILHLLAARIPIIHAFRRNARDSTYMLARLSSSVHPEYHQVVQLMSGKLTSPLYQPYAHCSVTDISLRCTTQHGSKDEGKPLVRLSAKLRDLASEESGSDSAIPEEIEVCAAVVLVGYEADLGFLQDRGISLTKDPHKPCVAKNNELVIDPFTGRCLGATGLCAVGPLVGDNFVRFLVGGAFAVASGLIKDTKASDRIEQCPKRGVVG